MTRDIAAELAALRKDYLSRLPAKLDELAALVESRSRAEARQAAHKLRGTAGTYGAGVFGEAIGAIDDALVGDLDWPTIDSFIIRARAALAERLER